MPTAAVGKHPHLVRTGSDRAKARQATLNPESIAKVIYGMYGVVNEAGTGGRARLVGLDVCGKTGTAQLASNEFLKGKTAKNLKDNAWFVGFAPRSAPEIVVVALFENGEHGPNAAPIVRDVIKAHFDKKNRAQRTLRAANPPQPGALLTRPGLVQPASQTTQTAQPAVQEPADPKNVEIIE